MCLQRIIAQIFLTFSFLAAVSLRGQAAEYGFSTYGLGESAFSAGVTPPPGTYVTAVTAYFSGKPCSRRLDTSLGNSSVLTGASAAKRVCRYTPT
jgi:hypothetical protein